MSSEQRPYSVLVVDDDPDIRRLITMLLSGDPDFAVVGEAGDGAQAIELAAAQQPDVIILDLVMPVMDGLTALPALRAAAPGGRVVVVTGSASEAAAHTALASGAAAFVRKGPSLVSRLVPELRAALRRD
jgi:CheY-like chemotaxis protein